LVQSWAARLRALVVPWGASKLAAYTAGMRIR